MSSCNDCQKKPSALESKDYAHHQPLHHAQHPSRILYHRPAGTHHLNQNVDGLHMTQGKVVSSCDSTTKTTGVQHHTPGYNQQNIISFQSLYNSAPEPKLSPIVDKLLKERIPDYLQRNC